MAPRRGTPAFAHAVEAAALAERACGSHLAEGEAASALAACEKVAAKGERAAAIVSLSALVDARRALLGLVERRRPVVIHAVTSFPGDEGVAAYADQQALGDIGVGVVVARDAQDAADLVVVAHRAAEDAETPIVILHDGFPASFARDRIVLPDAPLVRAALEPTTARAEAADLGLAPHRRAAARVPFALASSMRAFERLSGRKVDAVEAAHTEGADVVLVASGAIAETARALIEDLHARGKDSHPIGIVQLVVLRPFPAVELVRAIGRARAVAVIERVDAPLCQSNPLAMEVKSAFADALTWAPGYPGIGRIPTIFSACIDPSRNEATPGEILAVIENAIQGEHGPRAFRVGEHVRKADERRVHAEGARSIRWIGDPSLLVHLLTDLYGGHARATPRGTDAWDVTVGPHPVRAHHGATELDAIVLARNDHDQEAVAILRDGGAAIVVGDPASLAASLRGELDARHANIRSVPDAKQRAVLCGAIVRALPPAGLDRAQILAEAERSLRAAGSAGSATAASASDAEIRAALEAFARGYDAA